MLSWIKKQIKIWKMSRDFARQCQILMDHLNGNARNFIEIEVIHPETDNYFWFTIQRANGMSPAQKCTILKSIITNILTEPQLDCQPLCLNGQSVRQWLEKHG